MEQSTDKEIKVSNGDANNDQLGNFLQLIVFKQGTEEYALQIDQVKEVVLTPNITKMPQTPDFVKGVANIRGNIIAILNLEEKFGLSQVEPELNSEGKNFTLVIESQEFKIGVLVKEVPNTLAVREQDIEESVNVIHDTSLEQNYISGIVKKGDRLIILIDILKVVSESEINTVSQITQ